MTGRLAHLCRAFRRHCGAASAVEFALVVGPFLMLVFGTFEFGRLYWTQNAIQQAAISGARCVGIGQSECVTDGVTSAARTQEYVKDVAHQWLVPLVVADVTVDPDTSCSGMSGFSEVSISYEFQTSLPRFLVALAAPQPIRATSCFPKAAS